MNKFQLGYKQAVAEIIGGIVTPIIIYALASSGSLPLHITILLGLIPVVGNIALIFSMSSWGVLYTLGWLFGSIIFFKSGLLGVTGFILYIVLPVASLILRGIVWIRSKNTENQ